MRAKWISGSAKKQKKTFFDSLSDKNGRGSVARGIFFTVKRAEQVYSRPRRVVPFSCSQRPHIVRTVCSKTINIVHVCERARTRTHTHGIRTDWIDSRELVLLRVGGFSESGGVSSSVAHRSRQYEMLSDRVVGRVTAKTRSVYWGREEKNGKKSITRSAWSNRLVAQTELRTPAAPSLSQERACKTMRTPTRSRNPTSTWPESDDHDGTH